MIKTLSAAPHIGIITLYLLGRLLTVVLSVLTIYVTYRVGEKIFNRTAGLISALFISAAHLHITNSYTITCDSPMALWVMLSFFMSVLIYDRGPKWKYYLLSGTFCGLAAGTKYTGVFCAVSMVCAHIYVSSSEPKKVSIARLLSGLVMIPVAFIFTTPYSLIDYTGFIHNGLVYQQRAYALGHPGWERDVVSYGAYLGQLVKGYGLLQMALAGVGMVFLWIKNRRMAFLLLSFPIFYYLFMGAYKVYFARNMTVLIPFLALFSAYGVYVVLTDFKKHILIAFSVVVLAVFGVYQQTQSALEEIRKSTLPDIRLASAVWIEQNIPAGVKIARELYTPDMNELKYSVTRIWSLAQLDMEEIKSHDYLIASSLQYERYFRDRDRYKEEVQKYEGIFADYKTIKEFIPDDVTTGGPIIKIIKVPSVRNR